MSESVFPRLSLYSDSRPPLTPCVPGRRVNCVCVLCLRGTFLLFFRAIPTTYYGDVREQPPVDALNYLEVEGVSHATEGLK